MSAYTQQEKDFVLRTQRILEQYENFIKRDPRTEGFEFTLLLNCFVGLLIIPQQTHERRAQIKTTFVDFLSDKEIDEENFGIAPADIKTCVGRSENNKPKLKIDKSVQNVVRHFRNSVAHSRFTVNPQGEKISSVLFEDFDLSGNQTFQLELSLENIHKFAVKISKCFLEAMDKA